MGPQRIIVVEQNVDEVLSELKSAVQTLAFNGQFDLQMSEEDTLGATGQERLVAVIEDVRALINIAARGITVNPVVREYIVGAIAEALQPDLEQHGNIEVDRARILTLAGYLNSLRT